MKVKNRMNEKDKDNKKQKQGKLDGNKGQKYDNIDQQNHRKRCIELENSQKDTQNYR